MQERTKMQAIVGVAALIIFGAGWFAGGKFEDWTQPEVQRKESESPKPELLGTNVDAEVQKFWAENIRDHSRTLSAIERLEQHMLRASSDCTQAKVAAQAAAVSGGKR